MKETDPQLQRIERLALIACGGVAVAAAVNGGWPAVFAVFAGAALIAASFVGVRSGVDAALRTSLAFDATSRRRSMIWRLVKFITRFAILAFGAYVMMVRLRAQPWWMLAGATSVIAAPALEVLRQLRARS